MPNQPTVIEPASTPEPPRPRRRWRRRFVFTIIALAAPFAFFGCTSVVTQPNNPQDPTSVFILRDAMHIGLVVPDGRTPPQRYVEFGYGDWGFYALGKNAWYDTFATVLWATPGTLSRREFTAASPAQLRRAAHWTQLDELIVARADVTKLRNRLQAEFDSKRAQIVHQRHLRMAFVPADSSYWLGHTCADVAADWLRDLHCTVTFAPIRISLLAEK